MSVPTAPKEPIMIGGAELGRCPTRIHHDRFSEAERVVEPVIERRIADGRAWEDTVVAHVLEGSSATTATEPGTPLDAADPVVIPSGLARRDRELITTDALRAGVPLILGGRLRSSRLQSVGAPDLLVQLDDGYAPIDVKHHKAIGKTGIPGRTTSVEAIRDVNGPPCRFRSGRVSDLYQVAHYWNLLKDAGVANQRQLAGIIGAESSLIVVWVDLGIGDPSLLDRHRQALDEAIDIAAAGRLHPETPLVPAVWRGECRSCPWADFCRTELESVDHISLLPEVGAYETDQLLKSGITTTTQMASLTPDIVFGEYTVTQEAILQANARASGTLLRRPGVDLDLPDAAHQIDFDVETYLGSLYLAGLLVHEPEGSAFRPISDWSGTPAGERRVLEGLFRFLDSVAERGDAVVYHWTDYERTILREASIRHGLSLRSAPSVDEWFDQFGCDLWSWIKQRFVSPNGYSLKVIAPLCGFDWRDGDPGGAQSELWYVDALDGDDEQRVRILEYNEDDVAAQAAIRRWVRKQP
jgi:predicted RecB family nuclease